jgi:hypothetical protein
VLLALPLLREEVLRTGVAEEDQALDLLQVLLYTAVAVVGVLLAVAVVVVSLEMVELLFMAVAVVVEATALFLVRAALLSTVGLVRLEL